MDCVEKLEFLAKYGRKMRLFAVTIDWIDAHSYEKLTQVKATEEIALTITLARQTNSQEYLLELTMYA